MNKVGLSARPGVAERRIVPFDIGVKVDRLVARVLEKDLPDSIGCGRACTATLGAGGLDRNMHHGARTAGRSGIWRIAGKHHCGKVPGSATVWFHERQ